MGLSGMSGLSGLSGIAGGATEKTLLPDIDNYLLKNAATTNYGTQVTIQARASATAERAIIIKPDFSSIAAGAVLTSVKLYLKITAIIVGPITFTLNAILAANDGWTETGSTWDTKDGAAAWAGDTGANGGDDAGCSVSGTDFNATALGSFVVQNSVADQEYEIVLNLAQMQAMLTANYGILLRSNTNATVQFHSAEAVVAANHPRLVLKGFFNLVDKDWSKNAGSWSTVYGKYRHVPAISGATPLAAIVHITDTQGDPTGIACAVADINARTYYPAPDAVVLTGDLTQDGTQAQLQAVKDALDLLTVAPYKPVVGGHDISAEAGDECGHFWYNVFGALSYTYSWTIGNILCMVEDSEAPYGGWGTALNSAEHMAWIDAQLAANPTKVLLFFCHYSFNQFRDGGDAQTFFKDRADIRAKLEAHAMPVIEFSGHAHVYAVSNLNGVVYTVAGDSDGHGNYHYVKVFADRVEFYVVKLSDFVLASPPFADHWPTSSDSTHAVGIYSYGLPLERNFKIDLTSGTLDFLGGLSIYSQYSGANFTFLANIYMFGEDAYGGSLAGLVFRYADVNNYYDAILDTAGTLSLRKIVNGAVTVLQTETVTANLLTTYELKVITNGTSIKVYLDTTLIIDTTDATFATGQVGLKCYYAMTDFSSMAVA
jgi:hypothetical protein